MYEAVDVSAISAISNSRRFATTATGGVTERDLATAWSEWQQRREPKPSRPICNPIAVVAELTRLKCQCSSAKSLASTVLLLTLCNKARLKKQYRAELTAQMPTVYISICDYFCLLYIIFVSKLLLQ
jgi:hypothetical protein